MNGAQMGNENGPCKFLTFRFHSCLRWRVVRGRCRWPFGVAQLSTGLFAQQGMCVENNCARKLPGGVEIPVFRSGEPRQLCLRLRRGPGWSWPGCAANWGFLWLQAAAEHEVSATEEAPILSPRPPF